MTDLNPWLQKIKHWSRELARRRRRSDLIDDIASAAVEYCVSCSIVGQDPGPELERHVVRELDLADSFKLARDSDLTARVNERSKDRGDMSSYVEELLPDPKGEEQLLSAIDREPREEGRDQAELLKEVDQELQRFTLQEEQVLTLRHLCRYNNREIGQYLGVSACAVQRLSKRLEKRLKAAHELEVFRKRMNQDPGFTKLEVEWIKI